MMKQTRADKTGDGKHTFVKYDSLAEFIADNETNGRNPRWNETMNERFHGATSLTELYELARKGLPREGIKALELSDVEQHQRDRELANVQFQSMYDVMGSQVDVARYLSGEPECMVNYYFDERPRTESIVTLALGIAVNVHVKAESITKHGRRLVALAEAIDSSGLQTEIYVDFTGVSGRDSGRWAVRVKAPGELFDAGAFMFALTHPGMVRGLGFNTMQHWHTRALQNPGQTYGVSAFIETADYPAGTIYVPAMRTDADAGKCVDTVLRDLGLIRD